MQRVLAEYAGAASVDRVALPGGAWWLAEAATLSDGRLKRTLLRGHKPMRELLQSVLGDGTAHCVLLLGHQECSWYRLRFPGASPGDLVRRIGADLFRARDELIRWAPANVEVRGLVLLDGPAGTRRLF